MVLHDRADMSRLVVNTGDVAFRSEAWQVISVKQGRLSASGELSDNSVGAIAQRCKAGRACLVETIGSVGACGIDTFINGR